MTEKMSRARKGATSIVRTLRENGHKAYFVGGCVRDVLMGADPDTLEDFDIATSALPEAVRGLFRRTVPVGAAFGVILVLIASLPVFSSLHLIPRDPRQRPRNEWVNPNLHESSCFQIRPYFRF